MNCPQCHNVIPPSYAQCPHCLETVATPNVRAVAEPSEVAALDRRYDHARDDAVARGAGDAFTRFENAVATASEATISRPLLAVVTLVSGANQSYATYYQQIDAQLRLPDDDEWTPLRLRADMTLFPHYHEQVRMAALSLNGRGLPHYGDCTLVLKTSMVATRTTALESNSAVLMEKINYDLSKVKGLRSAWDARGRLAAAKMASELTPATDDSAFAGLLMRPGPTSREDDFIEVHVFGPFTARTLSRVVVDSSKRPSRAIVKALKITLEKIGLPLEALP